MGGLDEHASRAKEKAHTDDTYIWKDNTQVMFSAGFPQSSWLYDWYQLVKAVKLQILSAWTKLWRPFPRPPTLGAVSDFNAFLPHAVRGVPSAPGTAADSMEEIGRYS